MSVVLAQTGFFSFDIVDLLLAIVNYAFYILLGFIIASILFSWFPGYPSSSFMQGVFDLVGSVANPILMPIRSRIPPVRIGGFGLDLSPIIAIIGLYIARGLLTVIIVQFIGPVVS